MAEVISPPSQTIIMSQPRQIPQPAALPPSSSAPSLPLSATSGLRSGHLNLDIFSPVNQNGSFEFDRVLKSGEVLKRTRKTKVHLRSSNWPVERLTACTALAAMEEVPPGPAAEPSVHVQERVRRAIAQANQPIRPHSGRIPQRPQRSTAACFWPIFALAELSPTSQGRERCASMGGAHKERSADR